MTQNHFQNRAGFTLIEVLLSAGIFAALALAASAVGMYLQRSSSHMTNVLESVAQKNIAERIIYRDIRGGEVSYQLLSLQDDSKNNFFDYDPATSCESSSAKCMRTLTIEASTSNKNSPSLCLFTDDGSGLAVQYSPHLAYSSYSPLIYSAINYQSAFDKAAKAMDPSTPVTWPATNAQSKLFVLSSPLLLYPLTSYPPAPDHSKIPRQMVFLGKSQNLDLVSDAQLPGKIGAATLNTTHPLNPNLAINSPNVFFRNLPLVQGIAPVVFIRPIKLSCYQVKNEAVFNGKPNGGEGTVLTRAEYNPSLGGFDSERVILSHFKKLTLSRKIKDTAVAFSLEEDSSIGIKK